MRGYSRDRGSRGALRRQKKKPRWVTGLSLSNETGDGGFGFTLVVAYVSYKSFSYCWVHYVIRGEAAGRYSESAFFSFFFGVDEKPFKNEFFFN